MRQSYRTVQSADRPSRWPPIPPLPPPPHDKSTIGSANYQLRNSVSLISEQIIEQHTCERVSTAVQWAGRFPSGVRFAVQRGAQNSALRIGRRRALERRTRVEVHVGGQQLVVEKRVEPIASEREALHAAAQTCTQ